MTENMDETANRVDTRLTSETDLLDEIERIVRLTKKAYGYQHLSTIGSTLRDCYPDYDPKHYGYKKLLDLIEAYPERFKIKWSAPAHKGRSHVWVRLSTEPKRKEGYTDTPVEPVSDQPKPRLMTAKEFDRLCLWLSEAGMPDKCDGTLRKTRQWLRRRDFLNMNRNIKRLRHLGGYCDCEGAT
ncbi:MAG: DUF2695 domain-containing protein [Aggregatilineales bacterium]